MSLLEKEAGIAKMLKRIAKAPRLHPALLTGMLGLGGYAALKGTGMAAKGAYNAATAPIVSDDTIEGWKNKAMSRGTTPFVPAEERPYPTTPLQEAMDRQDEDAYNDESAAEMFWGGEDSPLAMPKTEYQPWYMRD